MQALLTLFISVTTKIYIVRNIHLEIYVKPLLHNLKCFQLSTATASKGGGLHLISDTSSAPNKQSAI